MLQKKSANPNILSCNKFTPSSKAHQTKPTQKKINGEDHPMNINLNANTGQEDKPLTRADIEHLLQKVGSSDKLILKHRNLIKIDLHKFSLHKTDLSGANLSEANLSGANLSGANLSGANLSFADLIGADLIGANLIGANLNGTYLSGADLSFANLSKTNLSFANFSFADLIGANFSEANLSKANLSKANLSKANLIRTFLNEANLIRANLSEAKLIGAKLIGAYLIGANLSDANLSEADLRGAYFIGAYFIGANLSRAYLSGADFSGADFSGADFIGADFIGADFIGADFSGVIGLNIAQIENAPTFRIRVIEEPLTPHNLISVISAITTLSTKCWLIANKRLADLIEYTQTNDIRFVEEAQLTITKIRHNSPLDASFKIDLSASNIAEAITTTIDGVTQIKNRLEKVELENKAKAQAIEHARQKSDQENKSALLEQERQELAIERERLEILEKRLEVQKKGIEYALEIANKTVSMLDPNADEQKKAMLIQSLLPTLLQLHNGKGLELILPAPQSIENKKTSTST
jgi:uncharacterized protein YjbI with pentapeptide repeats